MSRIEELWFHVNSEKDPEFLRRIIKKEIFRDIAFYEMLIKYGENSKRFEPFIERDSRFAIECEDKACAITWGGYDKKEVYFVVTYNFSGKISYKNFKKDREKGFTATKANIYKMIEEFRTKLFKEFVQ